MSENTLERQQLQDNLALNCPGLLFSLFLSLFEPRLVVYGKGSFPLCILLGLYLLCLFDVVQEEIFLLKSKKIRKNLLRILFLFLISLYLLARVLCLIVPFPFHKLTYYLVCDQLPRYFVFVGLQLLSFWLGSAVLSAFSKYSYSKIIILIIFVTLFFIQFILSIVLCVIVSVCLFVLVQLLF